MGDHIGLGIYDMSFGDFGNMQDIPPLRVVKTATCYIIYTPQA